MSAAFLDRRVTHKTLQKAEDARAMVKHMRLQHVYIETTEKHVQWNVKMRSM